MQSIWRSPGPRAALLLGSFTYGSAEAAPAWKTAPAPPPSDQEALLISPESLGSFGEIVAPLLTTLVANYGFVAAAAVVACLAVLPLLCREPEGERPQSASRPLRTSVPKQR